MTYIESLRRHNVLCHRMSTVIYKMLLLRLGVRSQASLL